MTNLAIREERTSHESRGPARPPRDVVSALTVYAVLRIVLPAQYVIGPLGAAGQPALLFGLGLTLWWLAAWLGQARFKSHVKQPLRLFALIFLLAVVVSYLVAAMRPPSANEQLGADRGLLNIIAWVGVMLTAMDGIPTRARLDTLLRRLVMLGALEGALGILQTLAGQSFIQYFRLPGFSNNGVPITLPIRGDFLRVAGTASHPIEYGVTLSMLLPIAFHFAVLDAGHRRFLARWFPVAIIALGLSQSISRSSVVCTAAALAILLLAWPRKLRRRMYLGGVVFVAIFAIVRPGFIPAISDLFTGASSDPSILSRTDSYPIAWSFIEHAPVFGRGVGTFLAAYWILDNQFLGSLIEIGVVGVVCMLLLFLCGGFSAWQLRNSEAMPESRAPATSRLGPALAGAIAAGCISFAFFDAWSFYWVPSTLFLIFGCVGALHRLTSENATYDSSDLSTAAVRRSGRPDPGRANETTVSSIAVAVRRRWPLAMAGLLVTLAGSYVAAKAPGVYYEQAAVVFTTPSSQGNASGAPLGSTGLVPVAAIIGKQVDEQGPLALSPGATIVSIGIHDGVWVRLPNSGDQWTITFDQAELDVEVVGDKATQVPAAMAAAVAKIRTVLRGDQLSVGAPANQLIGVTVNPPSPPLLYLQGSSARAGIAALAIGVSLTLTFVVVFDRWRRRRILATDAAAAP
jgi:O-antigen ligase